MTTKLIGLRYSRTTEPEMLLDLWLPDTPHYVPVVLFMHGHGTARGSTSFDAVATAIVDAGYAWASIDWGEPPTYTLPASTNHAFGAMRWLRYNYLTYKLLRKFCVMGSSAGALLATQVGMCSDDSAMVGTFADHVGQGDNSLAVLAISAALFDPDLNNMSVDAKAYLGSWYGCPDLAACANTALYLPQYHMTAASPPYLGIFGADDTDAPLAHGTATVAALQALGCDASMIVNASTGHGFVNATLQVPAILDFLTRTIGT